MEQPKKLPLTVGDLKPHLINVSFGPPKSPHKRVVLNTKNNRKSPTTTENCRKQPKTANQKTELFSTTSQIKLTLTITLTLTDTVTLTSQPNRKHRKHRKQTENNRKVFGCFRCLATPSQTGL